MQRIAKLPDAQTFTGRNEFAEGLMSDGPILLAGNYQALVKVNYQSSNAVDARTGGGNAGLYIQHGCDSSTTAIGNVNCGLRCQMQTFQQSTTSPNDAVGGYFGIYHAGVNVGGFGVHADAYHASSGASSTTYGLSAELFRTSAAGFTAGAHVRSISAAGYLDNDYGFLASPSPAGTKKFKSVFSAGSIFTGTMNCDYGLDLKFAAVGSAGVSMLDDVPLMWSDNTVTHSRTIKGEAAGRFSFNVNGSRVFGIEDSGRIEYPAGQIVGTSGGSSGQFLTIADSGGNVWKIPLDSF